MHFGIVSGADQERELQAGYNGGRDKALLKTTRLQQELLPSEKGCVVAVPLLLKRFEVIRSNLTPREIWEKSSASEEAEILRFAVERKRLR